MNIKSPSKPDTKLALLDTGMELMLEKGYTNTGIQEILNTAHIPKGSFYHHFDSKENYAVEIIRHFDQMYSACIAQTLGVPSIPPLERLRTYCKEGKAKLVSQECRKGCLIGNLSQEMSDQSEVLRKELTLVMKKWQGAFAACIAEGQASGTITNKHSADALAEFFLSSWSGAVLHAKSLKSPEPLDIFIDVMLDNMLKA